MKIVDLSAVSDSVGMPVKSGTVNHIQDSYKESVAESVKGLIGTAYNPAVMYILNGLVNSGAGLTYNISAGSVFLNGEVYLVDSAVFTAVAGQTAVGVLNTTFVTGPAADPVEFTDGVSRPVHQVRKIVLQAGLGGSGLANYADFVRINTNQPNVNITAGNAGITVGGAFPAFTVANNYPPQPNPVLGWKKIHLGDLNTDPTDPYTTRLPGSTNALTAYLHNFPVAQADSNFLVFLTVGNQGDTDWGAFNDNYMCIAQVGYYDATKMYFAVHTSDASHTQSIDLWYALIKMP